METFVGLHLILGRKTDLVLGWKIFILVFIILKFSGPPISKIEKLHFEKLLNMIYQFSYHCDSRYVGRTSQRLQDRINNTSPILSALALLTRDAYFLPIGANLPLRPIPSLLLLIQPLVITFYKIMFVLNIMTTVNSLL